MQFIHSSLVFGFFSVERQRLSNEGAEGTTMSGEKAESEKEMKMELQSQVEEVNNQLQLVKSEKSQYAGKCHDLEKEIKTSEDIRKDLSKKCSELEQQLILKEREWSLECKKMRSELEAKLKDVKNRELEAKLEEVNNQLQLAESKVNMLASTMIWKNR